MATRCGPSTPAEPTFLRSAGFCMSAQSFFTAWASSPKRLLRLGTTPFGAEIDAFPGLTYEAMFLYCYLLIKSGHETPPNLLAAIPDDFRTLTYEGKFMSKADLLSSGRDSATPRI